MSHTSEVQRANQQLNTRHAPLECTTELANTPSQLVLPSAVRTIKITAVNLRGVNKHIQLLARVTTHQVAMTSNLCEQASWIQTPDIQPIKILPPPPLLAKWI